MKTNNWIYLFGLIFCFTLFISCGEENNPQPCTEKTWFKDSDGDGLGDATMSTTACDQPEGYVDNDDDEDDTSSCTSSTWYKDSDGDGLGDPNMTLEACEKPDGYVDNNDDGDDSSAGLSPEEQKDILRGESLAFVDQMERLEETEATETLVAFRIFFETSEPENARLEPVDGFVSRILSFTKRDLSPSEFAQDDDPESLQEIWDEFRGIYAWNSSIGEWEYTAGGDIIQFQFPSREESTTNNAELTVRNYEGTIITGNPIEDDYTGDFPTEFLADLVVDDVKEMEYSFSIDYTDEGEPTSLETSLFVNPFTLSFDLTNTESKLGTGMSFKEGANELLGTDVEINGNFDDDNIEQADDLDDPSLVVFDGSLEFRIMNVKFLGEIDFDDLYDEINPVLEEEGEPGFDYEGGAAIVEAALNRYISIGTSYIDSGNEIAEVEFYTFVETDEFFPEDKYIEVGGRLLFSDGSKIDLEDYFEEGWDQVEDELDLLFDEIEKDLGE